MQWIRRGVNLKCVDAYTVLEWENDTKFHVFATKHKANTYNEQSTHSDNCVLF
jgi:tRNA G18 (ribose-2'-O)-methylase SpoU